MQAHGMAGRQRVTLVRHGGGIRARAIGETGVRLTIAERLPSGRLKEEVIKTNPTRGRLAPSWRRSQTASQRVNQSGCSKAAALSAWGMGIRWAWH